MIKGTAFEIAGVKNYSQITVTLSHRKENGDHGDQKKHSIWNSFDFINEIGTERPCANHRSMGINAAINLEDDFK